MLGVQLALVLDARRDDLTPADVAGAEAMIEWQDRERGRYGRPAPACRCGRRAWGDTRRRHCCRWGRDVEEGH